MHFGNRKKYCDERITSLHARDDTVRNEDNKSTYSSLLTDTLSFRDCEDEQLLPIVCLNKLSVTSSFFYHKTFLLGLQEPVLLFPISNYKKLCSRFFPEFPFKFSISLLQLLLYVDFA